MADDLQRIQRKVRLWLAVVLASLLGLRLAVDLYSGSRIELGLSLAFGIASVVLLLSSWLGPRFWRLLSYLG